MVTYIIGKAYDKNIYFSSSTKNLKKKLSDVHHKQNCFLAEVKKNLQKLLKQNVIAICSPAGQWYQN